MFFTLNSLTEIIKNLLSLITGINRESLRKKNFCLREMIKKKKKSSIFFLFNIEDKIKFYRSYCCRIFKALVFPFSPALRRCYSNSHLFVLFYFITSSNNFISRNYHFCCLSKFPPVLSSSDFSNLFSSIPFFHASLSPLPLFLSKGVPTKYLWELFTLFV